MVTHHELGDRDELGDEAEKIGQGQILKGLKPLGTRFCSSS